MKRLNKYIFKNVMKKIIYSTIHMKFERPKMFMKVIAISDVEKNIINLRYKSSCECIEKVSIECSIKFEFILIKLNFLFQSAS